MCVAGLMVKKCDDWHRLFKDGGKKDLCEYSENWIKRQYRAKMIGLDYKNVRFDIKMR